MSTASGHDPAMEGAAATARRDRLRRPVKPSSLRELWHSRELLWFFVVKEIRVRYKQMSLGVLWVVITPLLTAFIFVNVIFGGSRLSFDLARGSSMLPLYAGIAIWNYFSMVFGQGSMTLLMNAPLITKVYFPREIPVISNTISCLLDLYVAFALIPLLCFVTDTPLSLPGYALTLAGLPLVAFFCHVLALLFAALVARFRDIKVIVPFILMIGFFLSACFFPVSFYQPQFRPFVLANPLALANDLIRHFLFGTPTTVQPKNVVTALIVITITFVVSRRFFHRVQRNFVDHL